jgi:hypothetical protein
MSNPFKKRSPEIEEMLNIISNYVAAWLGEDVAYGTVHTIQFGINFVVGVENLLLLIREAILLNTHVAWVNAFSGVNTFINMEPNGDLKRALLLSFFDPLYRRLGIKVGSVLNDAALDRYGKALRLHTFRPETEGWAGRREGVFPQKVVVTGASHAGTTLAAAIVRASGQFDFYFGTEFRDLFTKDLTPRHGCKLSTDNMTFEDFEALFSKYKDLYIIFSVRNPVDIALSHIFRARPQEEGGDSWDGETDELANVEGACFRVRHMFDLYVKLKEKFPERMLVVNMEDTIRDLDRTLKIVCGFLFIDRTPSMEKPWEYIVHKFMDKRYNKMDTSQIDVYKRWETAYGGFYADKKEVVVELCKELKPIAEYLGYELEEMEDEDSEDGV